MRVEEVSGLGQKELCEAGTGTETTPMYVRPPFSGIRARDLEFGGLLAPAPTLFRQAAASVGRRRLGDLFFQRRPGPQVRR